MIIVDRQIDGRRQSHRSILVFIVISIISGSACCLIPFANQALMDATWRVCDLYSSAVAFLV
jgi:hypothetical protein